MKVFENILKKRRYRKIRFHQVTAFEHSALRYLCVFYPLLDYSISIADFFPPNRQVDFYCDFFPPNPHYSYLRER